MLELSREMKRQRREMEEIAFRFATYHVFTTILSELWSKLGDRPGAWFLHELEMGRTTRRPYLRPNEREVLFRLFDSEKPLTKWRLSHPTGERGERTMNETGKRTKRLGYTQVRRAVVGLLGKKAIEPVPGRERRWKSGIVVVNYRPTALGRFFYLRSQIGLHYYTEFSHRDEFFLDCLQDVGVFTKSRVLKDLVLSIRNISNRLTRSQHLLALSDTVLENCEKLGNPYYEMKVGCGFVRRAWSNWKDISAYRGCVPAKYRMLLRMTRRELLAWDGRIGTVLKSPSKTGCRSQRFRSARQDPWSWKRHVQEEVEREEMIKREWIHRMQKMARAKVSGFG